MALNDWLLNASLEKHNISLLRRKNGFADGASAGGGYRDIKYNLLFRSAQDLHATGRTIVEVQVILAPYLAVKKKMHAIYRIDRGDFG